MAISIIIKAQLNTHFKYSIFCAVHLQDLKITLIQDDFFILRLSLRHVLKLYPDGPKQLDGEFLGMTFKRQGNARRVRPSKCLGSWSLLKPKLPRLFSWATVIGV